MPGVTAVLGCEQTVTLYHRSYDPAARADVWQRSVYPGASWYGAQAATVRENGLLTADTYRVRIATGDEIDAAPGDVLVLGEVSDAVSGSAELTGKYHGRCFVVTHVQDNRRGLRRAWHWRIEGA